MNHTIIKNNFHKFAKAWIMTIKNELVYFLAEAKEKTIV